MKSSQNPTQPRTSSSHEFTPSFTPSQILDADGHVLVDHSENHHQRHQSHQEDQDDGPYSKTFRKSGFTFHSSQMKLKPLYLPFLLIPIIFILGFIFIIGISSFILFLIFAPFAIGALLRGLFRIKSQWKNFNTQIKKRS